MLISSSFQVPEEGNKTLYIPLVSNNTEELDTCREFRDPSDHGAGTQVKLASDWYFKEP